jgi:hypothetical protein
MSSVDREVEGVEFEADLSTKSAVTSKIGIKFGDCVLLFLFETVMSLQ